ncbi:MAG: hypothetical protein ACLQU1_36530 [Bryobacteraceae bacterium]
MPAASAQVPDTGSPPAPIATDRPAVTDSSAVVPSGVFQAENGVLDTDNQGNRTLDFSETLIRFGIASGTELRFTAPDYYQDSMTSAGPRSGFGDLAAGIKQQLCSVSGGFEGGGRLTQLPDRGGGHLQPWLRSFLPTALVAPAVF